MKCSKLISITLKGNGHGADVYAYREAAALHFTLGLVNLATPHRFSQGITLASGFLARTLPVLPCHHPLSLSLDVYSARYNPPISTGSINISSRFLFLCILLVVMLQRQRPHIDSFYL